MTDKESVKKTKLETKVIMQDTRRATRLLASYRTGLKLADTFWLEAMNDGSCAMQARGHQLIQ